MLDPVHHPMVLFATNGTEAMKGFLVDKGMERETGFWTLPRRSLRSTPPRADEKRWAAGLLAR